MKLFLFLIISAVIIVGCSVKEVKELTPTISETSQDQRALQDRQMVSVTVNGKTLSVEVVNSLASITKGLGERDSIGSDGMLFVLPERRVASFWMHGMRFPLDFIWIDGNTIVGVTANVPAPDDPSSINLPSYSSEVPVTHVLELAAGKAAELSITKGQTIGISY